MGFVAFPFGGELVPFEVGGGAGAEAEAVDVGDERIGCLRVVDGAGVGYVVVAGYGSGVLGLDGSVG